MKIAERIFLPSVRNAAAETYVLTDGFSCREQAEQLTDRKPLHLAQLIQKGLKE